MPKPILWYLACGGIGFLLAFLYRAIKDGRKPAMMLLLLVIDAPIATFGLLFVWPLALPMVFMMTRDVDELRDGRPGRSKEVDGSRESRARLNGEVVETLTDLKPGGKVLVKGEKCDAFSRQGFVKAGTPVEIVGSDDLRLEVKEVDE